MPHANESVLEILQRQGFLLEETLIKFTHLLILFHCFPQFCLFHFLLECHMQGISLLLNLLLRVAARR